MVHITAKFWSSWRYMNENLKELFEKYFAEGGHWVRQRSVSDTLLAIFAFLLLLLVFSINSL